MTSSHVRTRFAPSPTGDLHLGNLRIAVFNHLFARHHGGAFIIRIEDTDVERNRPEAVDRILEDLRWAGIDWDEGPDGEGDHGPYFQSERESRHRELALQLLDRGLAYLCFCREEDVSDARRDEAWGPGCPGGCRDRPSSDARSRRDAGEAAVVRFAVPDGAIEVTDEIRGRISFHGKDVRDFVILRADGRPTYNFAVVADDVDMRISHVIRGAGHLSNTPKQALLFDALDVQRPAFAHLPTVLGPDGTRLSKRTGSPGVDQLRAEGFHPDGVVNYLSLLGWSPGEDREVLSREELVAEIDLERAGASNTVYDPDKLRWMSQQHIQRMSLEALTDAVAGYVDRTRFSLDRGTLELAVDAIRTRLATFSDVNEHLSLVFAPEEALTEGRREVGSDGEEAYRIIQAVRNTLASTETWDPETLGTAVRQVGRDLEARGPALFHPVRLAISGHRSGPDVGKVLTALGRARTLELLDRCLAAD